MRATIIEAPHRMTVGAWDTPKPAEGEVLISVRAAGNPRGDLYFLHEKILMRAIRRCADMRLPA